MRPAADLIVIKWLDAQPTLSVWTTSVTIFELRAGISIMPEGRRRVSLRGNFDRVVENLIEGRILAFAALAAMEAARLAGIRRGMWRPNELRDTTLQGV